jgi:hypothetical protein
MGLLAFPPRGFYGRFPYLSFIGVGNESIHYPKPVIYRLLKFILRFGPLVVRLVELIMSLLERDILAFFPAFYFCNGSS